MSLVFTHSLSCLTCCTWDRDEMEPSRVCNFQVNSMVVFHIRVEMLKQCKNVVHYWDWFGAREGVSSVKCTWWIELVSHLRWAQDCAQKEFGFLSQGWLLRYLLKNAITEWMNENHDEWLIVCAGSIRVSRFHSFQSLCIDAHYFMLPLYRLRASMGSVVSKATKHQWHFHLHWKSLLNAHRTVLSTLEVSANSSIFLANFNIMSSPVSHMT